MTIRKALAAGMLGIAAITLGTGAASAAVGAGVVHTGVDPDTGAWDGNGQRPPALEGHSYPAPSWTPGNGPQYDPNNVDPSGQLPNGGDGF